MSLTPSLYQETVGEGLPAAEHSKLILPEFLKKRKNSLKTIQILGNLKVKTLAYKLIYIPIDDTQLYPFIRLRLMVERLNTQPKEPFKIH